MEWQPRCQSDPSWLTASTKNVELCSVALRMIQLQNCLVRHYSLLEVDSEKRWTDTSICSHILTFSQMILQEKISCIHRLSIRALIPQPFNVSSSGINIEMCENKALYIWDQWIVMVLAKSLWSVWTVVDSILPCLRAINDNPQKTYHKYKLSLRIYLSCLCRGKHLNLMHVIQQSASRFFAMWKTVCHNH